MSTKILVSKALESPGSLPGDLGGIWILRVGLICGGDCCCQLPCSAAALQSLRAPPWGTLQTVFWLWRVLRSSSA